MKIVRMDNLQEVLVTQVMFNAARAVEQFFKVRRKGKGIGGDILFKEDFFCDFGDDVIPLLFHFKSADDILLLGDIYKDTLKERVPLPLANTFGPQVDP